MLSSHCLISFVVRFSHVRPATIVRLQSSPLLGLVRVRRWQRVCTPTIAFLFIWIVLIVRTFSYRVNGKFLQSKTSRKIPPRMSHVHFLSSQHRAARQTPSERHENHKPSAHTPKSLNKLFTWFSVHAFRMTSNVILFPVFDTQVASAHLIFAAHIGKKLSI